MVREKRELTQTSVRIYSQDMAEIKRIADETDTDTSHVIRRIISEHFTPKRARV